MNEESKEAAAKEAMKNAKQFTEVYYKMIQDSRHAIENLYHDDATMSFSGNQYKNKVEILNFIQETMPPITYHNVKTLDSQQVGLGYTGGKKTILLLVTGTVKYGSEQLKAFHQTFTIANMDQKWKILSETIRLHT